MGRAIILGSASAVPDRYHENTHLLVEEGQRVILVDCPGSPMVRLEQAGVAALSVTDLILTHFHPDHVSGLAPLLLGMWLIGRKDPLTVYGLAETIDRAQRMMALFYWDSWPNFYPVEFVCIPAEERALVFESPEVRVFASPVDHLIPTVGLRFELASGAVLAYSCDTRPSPVVVRLAQGADVLIHESTGASEGHTPPEKAGEIATQAGAAALYLIHYPPQLVQPQDLLARARQTFNGPITVAEDLLTIPL